MKKLLFISMLFFAANLFGQTVQDTPNDIIIYSAKDTIVLSKSTIVAIFPTATSVMILTNSIEVNRLVHGFIELHLVNYSGQFATVAKMFEYLKKAKGKDYIKIAHYTGENLDTLTFKINTTIVYRKVNTYSGTKWTGDKILIP
jgi:hypothetical protein